MARTTSFQSEPSPGVVLLPGVQRSDCLALLKPQPSLHSVGQSADCHKRRPIIKLFLLPKACFKFIFLTYWFELCPKSRRKRVRFTCGHVDLGPKYADGTSLALDLPISRLCLGACGFRQVGTQQSLPLVILLANLTYFFPPVLIAQGS